MSKLARMATTSGATGTVQTTGDTVTNLGGAVGFRRDIKSELFMLAVANMVGEDTFYEAATDRDARFRLCVSEAALADPAWTAQLIKWLRSGANMRSASVVAAIEYGRSVQKHYFPFLRADLQPGSGNTPREVLDAALQRADEPAEALGYWLAQYGKPLPKWMKKGLGDAATRLYTEKSALKYDQTSSPVRMADVIEFSQVRTESGSPKAQLFQYLIDRRHGRANISKYPDLHMIEARGIIATLDDPRAHLLSSPSLTHQAGMTWENISAYGAMDKMAWEAVIPEMGYMALIRNLRNFDEAEIDLRMKKLVASRLTDPEQVARSRQLPFRFFSAYQNVASDFWKPVLNEALGHSLKSVPQLKGDTLVMIDTSQSMTRAISAKSKVSCAQQAALFGMALAKGQKDSSVEVWGFDSNPKRFETKPAAEVLPEVKRFMSLVTGGATLTASCLIQILTDRRKRGVSDPARIVIVSDEQITESAQRGWYNEVGTPALPQVVPQSTILYTFNIGGYGSAHAESGMPNRHSLTGLADSSFQIMAMLEAGRNGVWPWEL